jgi:hypothetical protein
MAGVVIGLPSGMLPSPETAVSDGVTGQWIKIQPNNVSSVTNAATTLSTTTTGVQAQVPFTSQQVNFTLGGGKKGMWIDTSRSYINFRVKYEVSTTITAGSNTALTSFLQGGAMSWFDRATTYSAEGAILDDMVGVGQIFHHDALYNLDCAARDSLALNYGYSFDSAATNGVNNVQGHAVTILNNTATTSVAAASNFFSYSVPAFSSIFGTLNKSGFFPLGSLPKLDFQLTTAAIAPVVITNSVALTAGAVKFTIDNFSVNLWAITLDTPSMQLLSSPREHYIHSKTYRLSVNQIPAGATGQQSYLIGARGRSVRYIATRVSDAVISTAASASGLYDSKLPLAFGINYLLNGRDKMPPNPINLSINPSEAFLHTLYSHEEYDPEMARSSVLPSAFCKYWATGTAPTAAAGYDQQIVDAGSSSEAKSLASFSFCEDLRKLSKSKIMDGVNLSQSASHFLEINIDSARGSSNINNLSFITCLDQIVTIDMESGMISVLM